MEQDIQPRTVPPLVRAHLARRVFVSFILTFAFARIVVFLIMSRIIPDFYLYIKGSHIHHLNYGIFLLAIVGGFLLFRCPDGKTLKLMAVIYGIGMALTFDEFGMWLHLGGPYWQRASWDAVIVVLSALGLIAFAPSIKKFKLHHWLTAIVILLALAIFAFMLIKSFSYVGKIIEPKLLKIETNAPK